MNNGFYIGLGLAAALFAAPVVAQDEVPETGQPEAVPAFVADDLAAILTPAPATRSLVAGAGPEPGTPGSGVQADH